MDALRVAAIFLGIAVPIVVGWWLIRTSVRRLDKKVAALARLKEQKQEGKRWISRKP